tara:strand:+ start:60 stop:197 length:138 start_codon:yes stop_codon:yes gene_type:complete
MEIEFTQSGAFLSGEIHTDSGIERCSGEMRASIGAIALPDFLVRK